MGKRLTNMIKLYFIIGFLYALLLSSCSSTTNEIEWLGTAKKKNCKKKRKINLTGSADGCRRKIKHVEQKTKDKVQAYNV